MRIGSGRGALLISGASAASIGSYPYADLGRLDHSRSDYSLRELIGLLVEGALLFYRGKKMSSVPAGIHELPLNLQSHDLRVSNDRMSTVQFQAAEEPMGLGATELPVLNSLWVGEELGYLERLSLQSALDHGHRFRVYSYIPDKLRGVPSGVEIHDASEIMPREKLISYAECENGVALGANIWRYHMLAKGLGFWCDLDLVFVRPLNFDQPYVFGWEYEGWINNAVMLAPSDSDFVHDLFRLTEPNVRPPWFGPRRSLQFYWRRWRTGYLGLEDMPWGTYSAGLVTHIVKKRRLQQYVAHPDVFYPVRWNEARLVYDDADLVNEKIAANTRAVHLWHSRLGDLVSSPPPAGSWIAQQCERFGVEC